MEIITRITEAGFTLDPRLKKMYMSGWMGCSTYQPDVQYTKGDKIVDFSIGGAFMPLPIVQVPFDDNGTTRYYSSYDQSVISRMPNVYYIGLKQGEKYVYQSWEGKLPEPEVLHAFITGQELNITANSTEETPENVGGK